MNINDKVFALMFILLIVPLMLPIGFVKFRKWVESINTKKFRKLISEAPEEIITIRVSKPICSDMKPKESYNLANITLTAAPFFLLSSIEPFINKNYWVISFYILTVITILVFYCGVRNMITGTEFYLYLIRFSNQNYVQPRIIIEQNIMLYQVIAFITWILLIYCYLSKLIIRVVS